MTWCVLAAGNAAVGAAPPSAPEKEFKRLFSHRVGALWYAAIRPNGNWLKPGSVKIEWNVLPTGKLGNVRVISNSADALSAQLALGAIRSAQLPALPPDLRSSGLIAEVNFRIFPDDATPIRPVVYLPLGKDESRLDRMTRLAFARYWRVIELPASRFTLPTTKRHGLPPRVEANGRRVTGRVLLGFIVRTDGLAEAPAVLEFPDPRLKAAALAALKDWRFIPARLDGRPVPIFWGQQYDFR